ncbi:hypothetical protein MHTCC0001_14680 [Flavobacteriaceae bacterium MHTCC 0001]
MKFIFCILLILLLSFSALGAQNEKEMHIVPRGVHISVEKPSAEIFSAIKIEKNIAKSSSDIRIYLNIERKVENIKLIFPKINRRKLA